VRLVATVGRVLIVLAEADYRFGVGPLRLRVANIDWAHPMQYDGEAWYSVQGVLIGHDGGDRGQRLVLVRGKRLPGGPGH
jgi:hypothetical protein